MKLSNCIPHAPLSVCLTIISLIGIPLVQAQYIWESLDGPAEPLVSMAYGNDRLVGLGASGMVHISTDGGDSWISVPVGSGQQMGRTILFDGEHFCVAHGKWFARSEDGLKWSLTRVSYEAAGVSVGPNTGPGLAEDDMPLMLVHASPGLYLGATNFTGSFVTPRTAIWASQDGRAWRAVYSIGGWFNGLAYDGERYFTASRTGGSGTPNPLVTGYGTSQDGITWEDVDSNLSIVDFKGYAGGYYYAFDGSSQLYYSTDALVWNAAAVASGAGSFVSDAMEMDGAVYFATTNGLLRSNNGRLFELTQSVALLRDARPQSALAIQDRILISTEKGPIFILEKGSSSLRAAAQSSAITGNINIAEGETMPRSDWGPLRYDNEDKGAVFFAFSDDGKTVFTRKASSSGVSGWEPSLHDENIDVRSRPAMWGNRIYLYASELFYNENRGGWTTVFVTDDGTDWTVWTGHQDLDRDVIFINYTPQFGRLIELNNRLFWLNAWPADGYEYINGKWVYRQDFPAFGDLNFGGGLFVGAGNNLLGVSSDGVDFSTFTVGAVHGKVFYLNGKFIFPGSSSAVYVAEDGVTGQSHETVWQKVERTLFAQSVNQVGNVLFANASSSAPVPLDSSLAVSKDGINYQPTLGVAGNSFVGDQRVMASKVAGYYYLANEWGHLYRSPVAETNDSHLEDQLFADIPDRVEVSKGQGFSQVLAFPGNVRHVLINDMPVGLSWDAAESRLTGISSSVGIVEAWLSVATDEAIFQKKIIFETEPSEGIPLFGDDLYVFPENTPGTSQWYFSFTFKSVFHFADTDWYYLEELGAYVFLSPENGSLSEGFWGYFAFPEHSTWAFTGRDGYFGDLRDSNGDGVNDLGDNQAGSQPLSGYLYLDESFAGDSPGGGWYFFGEYPDGNWITQVGNPGSDWIRLK